MTTFQIKFNEEFEKVKSIDQLREEDEMIGKFFKIADYIYQTDIDRVSPDLLQRFGGQLSSIFAYLGVKSANLRASRDIAENTLKQMEKQLLLTKLDGKYKVSEARALVMQELGQEHDKLVIMEATKNQMEAIVEAIRNMLVFIQSVMKQLDAERKVSTKSFNGNNQS